MANNNEDNQSGIADYLSRDTNGVKLGIYTVAGALLGIAYFRKRPITKFTKPSKIPDLFIAERFRQRGKVEYIESHLKHGPLLQVNHYPPLNLFNFGKKTLPIKLSGIEVSANGFSWLQHVVVDHRVEFIPLVKHTDRLECLVFLTSNTKKQIDLAEQLLNLGFARTNNLPLKIEHDRKLERYYKLLNSVEKQAKKRRQGEWNWRLPQPFYPVRALRNLLDKMVLSVTPKSRRLPQLVRP